MNIELSEKLITQLVEVYGVNTFCLCPGGRSAPLVSVLSHTKGVEVLSFFEERSAGFFGLGRCRRDNRPCAVVTTSGTAVAELLPSVIEAYYSHLPLILITADRPSSYRKTGAPQTIEQVGIFSHYVEYCLDLEKNIDMDLSSWSGTLPCHINVCFDEPLINKKVKSLNLLPKKISSKKLPLALSTEIENINIFFKKVKKPLCILTELPDTVKDDMENALCFFSWPVYAETLSGLRESEKLKPIILKSGESFLNWLVVNKKIDGVIRIGRRPCTRFWRNLEKTYSHLPVLSVSDQSYSGLSWAHPAVSFSAFFDWSSKSMKNFSNKKGSEFNKESFEDIERVTIFQEDKKYSQHLNHLLSKYSLSEPALIRQLSQRIPTDSLLFLGNSLPIREWNLAGSYENKLKYISNRGANGIDGLISTFFGVCEPHRQNWCVLGDLSCLYDLSAPWILRQIQKDISCFIVIINNQGGQIFSSLFSDSIFLNSHNLQFKAWSQMWNLNYYCITQWPKVFSFSSPAVIEVKVDPSRTKLFEREYCFN